MLEEPREVYEADRRFLRRLLLVSGPAFVLGGWLAAFSVIGALLIFTGIGMLAAGMLLLTRVPVLVAAGAGVLVAALLVVWMALDLG